MQIGYPTVVRDGDRVLLYYSARFVDQNDKRRQQRGVDARPVHPPLHPVSGHQSGAFIRPAAGSIRFELCEENGTPIPGFTLQESEELFGNDVAHMVRWKQGQDLGGLAGRPVRLRAVLHDADLYSIQFRAPAAEEAGR